MRAVTAEFCAWVASLGGENNIEESTITSLFASGYETKPALSVPIHVVELTNVPPELRSSAKIQAPDPLDGLPDTAQTTMKQVHWYTGTLVHWYTGTLVHGQDDGATRTCHSVYSGRVTIFHCHQISFKISSLWNIFTLKMLLYLEIARCYRLIL